MLTPTDLILIFLVSKPLFVGLCLLIIASRPAPPQPATRRALPAPPKLLPHHE